MWQFISGVIFGTCYAWFIDGFKQQKNMLEKHDFNNWNVCEKCGKEVESFETMEEALNENCENKLI